MSRECPQRKPADFTLDGSEQWSGPGIGNRLLLKAVLFTQFCFLGQTSQGQTKLEPYYTRLGLTNLIILDSLDQTL